MSIRERKYFADPQAGLNSDDDAFAVGINEWVNAENVRSGTSDKYATGVVQAVGSNLLLNQNFDSVTIGTQEWQGKNLDVVTYQNGDPIPLVTDPTAWSNLTTGAYCYVNGDSANTDTYGLLYNWYAINDPRGIAPLGWKVPTQLEFQELLTYLGGIGIAGGKMKEIGTIHWNAPNFGATNESQFTALGSGFRDTVGLYAFKDYATFWTKTPGPSTGNGLVSNLNITLGGSGYNYTPLSYFTNVSTTGGSGTGLTVDIIVGNGSFGSAGVVWYVAINNPGSGYSPLDIIYIDGLSHIVSAQATILSVTNNTPITSSCNILNTANAGVFVVNNNINYGFSIRLIKDANCITLGSTEDETRGRLLYFLLNTMNSADSRIMCYDIKLNLFYNVLFDSQVKDGLSFNKDFPIHNAKVLEDLLVWTDNNGEPRCINIEAGIALNQPSYITNTDAYSLPIKYETTTLIKRPPNLNLAVKKIALGGVSVNTIKDNAYQFCYRYIYKDDQESALSTYSALIPPNLNLETANAIEVQIPRGEYIDDDIVIIQICAKYGNNGITQVIHSWSKEDVNDAILINNHNLGIANLYFNFTDNNVSFTLDTITAATPFDAVPLKSETLELAKNRVFLGNNLVGYSIPNQTSLNASVVNINTAGGGSISGTWYRVQIAENIITGNLPYTPPIPVHAYPYLLGTDGLFYYSTLVIADNPTAWQWNYTNPPTPVPPLPTPPQIIYFSQCLGGAGYATLDALVTAIKSYYYVFFGWQPGYLNVTTSLGSGIVTNYSSSILNSFFKSSSRYSVSIAFYDRFRRKCGIVNDKIFVDTTARTSSQLTFNDHIQWQLNNTNALDEIPNWAYYYQIHITKNLTTRFFQQAKSYNIRYVTRNTDLTLNYVQSNIYPLNAYAIAIDISYLATYGLGYSFEAGDFCNLIYAGVLTNILRTSQILGQDGNFILIQPFDLGIGGFIGTPIADFSAIFEIFTPYKSSDLEPYYETGNLMPINNPATSLREYSVTTGLLYGDSFALERIGRNGNTYIAEAMSPNDAVWKTWNTDTGWVNYFTRIGQTRKTNSIKFSDTFIPGSKINGINKYLLGNEKSLDIEMGTLRKLKLSSKVQGEIGSIMLGICESQTASLYIGETQQYGSSSQSTLTLSTDVIGSINILKGSFGTINPESVCEFKGNVYWLDVRNGRYIQYSPNGLFPISNKKMTIFWKLFSELYSTTSPTTIEEFGYRPFVFTTVDPHHFELLISIPKLSASPTNGYTPDYPSMIYPFNIWDGQAKTIVYSLLNDTWRGSYSFCAENFITSSNSLYSFNKCLLYKHNQENNFNNFYGVQNSSKIMFVSNMQPNAPKVYDNIMIEGNLKPNFVYFYNNYPYTQTSDLIDTDFRDYEGLHNAVIFRNKIVPTISGYTTDGLLTGEYMRNVAMYCMTEWNITDTQLLLKFATIGFAMSRGYEQK